MRNVKIALVFAVFCVTAGLFMVFALNNGKTGNEVKTASTQGKGSVAGANSSDDYSTKLAKELKNRGAILYCSKDTTDCKNQLKELPGDENYIDYVECDSTQVSANSDECSAQGIDVYPTWVYGGKKITGVQSLAELAKMIDFGQN